MSRSRFEGEERPPVQPITDIEPIVPLTPLQRLLASRYRIQPRTQAFRNGENGIVGAAARDATLAEVREVLDGGVHRPIDAAPLKVKRPSHAEYVRAQREGRPSPDTYQPMFTDYDRLRQERLERKATAKALRSKGNKGRKSA